MLKSLAVVMELRRPPDRPFGEAAAAVFDHLLSVFAPRRFVYAIDDGQLRYLSCGERGRWNGEELTSGALTSCPPGEARELVGELCAALATVQLSQLWVGAEGALLHRAPHASEAAWFGRWRVQRSLHELVELSFGWSDDLHGFEIHFPNEGYPLTSTELRAVADGDRWIDRGDAASASDNRARIFGVLAGIPSVLGMSRDDVHWELCGDTGTIEARYPDDATALDEQLARLRL